MQNVKLQAINLLLWVSNYLVLFFNYCYCLIIVHIILYIFCYIKYVHVFLPITIEFSLLNSMYLLYLCTHLFLVRFYELKSLS